MTDTIFALSSGAGRAGVAVFRRSGPRAGAALLVVTRRDRLPAPRRAVRISLWPPDGGAAIDHGLALWFPEPASFTGEDVAELHLHGGRAVIAAALAALGAVAGLRLAEPGEFTRRAFARGKLDLTAVEGMADLVAAETEAQRVQALRQMDGALARLYDGWRERLLRALAYLEAEIDFSDQDLDDEATAGVRSDVAALQQEIAGHLADRHRGERLREGLSIVILGPPNVGKSSVLNALTKRDVAIVSALAGTTRDSVETHLDLDGLPVTIADTAGLREAADVIESEGIRRALARAEGADLKLVVTAATDWPALAPETVALLDSDALLVVNKCDLRRDAAAIPSRGDAISRCRAVHWVSATTGEGLADLVAALAAAAAERLQPGGAPALTRARHREALLACGDGLARFLDQPAAELAAEDLRLAARALGRITGRVDVEDLLDVIFRDFCIGK